jgi:hypothetical protein
LVINEKNYSAIYIFPQLCSEEEGVEGENELKKKEKNIISTLCTFENMFLLEQ